MSQTVFELQKRPLSAYRWKHVGYFRNEWEAVTEQHLPLGTSYLGEWRVVRHEALLDPDQPDKAFLVNRQEVPLGRTAFFT